MYNILIVDDVQNERDGVEFLLNEYKIPVIVEKIANGREAINILKKGKTDVLFTDIKMPFVDGLSLCEIARDFCPELAIIIFSSFGEFEFAQKAITLKVDDYLLKPLEISEFLKVINKAIGKLDFKNKQKEKQKKILEKYINSSTATKEEMVKKLLKMESEEIYVSATNEESKNRIIKKVIQLVEKNYHLEIGLEELADSLYLSPSYLSGLFKKETGKTLMQFITSHRMHKAKELLSDTNMKITDICEAVGYNNDSYFCLLFKKTFNITPMQFRNGE